MSNKRVLIKTGIVARKSIEVLLNKVESIGVEESGLGRVLGYGTVVVRGTGGTSKRSTESAIPTNSAAKSKLRLARPSRVIGVKFRCR